jgi:hypothetical protein
MEIDRNAVRARFAGMTREELLEEAALRADEYTPLARRILEGEALARGISAEQVEERRKAHERGGADAAADGAAIDHPALLTSSDEKQHMIELVRALRGNGIAAVVRELDTRAFHGSGHLVGRWGLMVSGPRAGEAARILEELVAPAAEDFAGAGCGGGCGSCGGDAAPAGDEEWPEDGDWWKTVPGEDDREGAQG